MGRIRPRPPVDPTPAHPPVPAPDPGRPAPAPIAPTPAPTPPSGGVGTVTADTPIREVGDVSTSAFRAFAKGGPLEAVAAECAKAARGWVAMALTFAKKESSLGTGESARRTQNPLGLMRRAGDARPCLQLPGGCLLDFSASGGWAAAFAEYAARIGTAPYDPAKSLKHNVLVYVGGPRCPDILENDPNGVCANGHRWDSGNPDTDLKKYVDQTVARINAVKALDGAMPEPPPDPPKPAPPADPYAVMFGDAPYRMGDFGWRTMTGYANYHYGVGHGTTDPKMHTGQDVLAAYGTPYFALGPGKVVCVGDAGTPLWGQGCGAFADTGDRGPEGNPPRLGVGNVTVLYDAGVKVTTGHSREAFVRPGQRVDRGTRLGTVGGMRGAHLHVDTVIPKDGSYLLIDPADGLRRVLAGGVPKPEPEPSFPWPVQWVEVAGLAGRKVPLPADMRFRVQLTPRGSNRSGIPLTWTGVTQHETGNRGTNAHAAMHANWQGNGTPGHPDGKVGVHFYVDDNEIVQCLPANEQGVHSGDFRNQQHVAIELCVNAGRNSERAERNSKALCAALLGWGMG